MCFLSVFIVSQSPFECLRHVTEELMKLLRKLLLDEEAAEVRKLPGAGSAEDDELQQDPADDAGVGGLGLITEFGFTFLFRLKIIG